MTCKAKIYLQRPNDGLGLSIGTKKVSRMLAEGRRVRFEHHGGIIGGLVRSVDPADWEQRSVTPAIVVKMTPGA